MLNPVTKKVILITLIVLFCASLVLNVVLAYRCLTAMETYKNQRLNAKILDFMDMFLEDVLMAKEEISFDTRLSLENSVRSLNDEEIFTQWQKFTKVTSKDDASTEVKILLSLLVKRIEQ